MTLYTFKDFNKIESDLIRSRIEDDYSFNKEKCAFKSYCDYSIFTISLIKIVNNSNIEFILESTCKKDKYTISFKKYINDNLVQVVNRIFNKINDTYFNELGSSCCKDHFISYSSLDEYIKHDNLNMIN